MAEMQNGYTERESEDCPLRPCFNQVFRQNLSTPPGATKVLATFNLEINIRFALLMYTQNPTSFFLTFYLIGLPS